MISIAMATYNGERYLREQLDSIYSQTLLPFEVVVCDDCSTDNTIEILKEYQIKYGLNYFSNDRNLGFVKNFEKAISLCKGDYIALSDQDDVWREDKLFLEVKKIQSLESKYGSIPILIYSDLEMVDRSLNLINKSFWKSFRIVPQKLNFRIFLINNFITGCTVLFNKVLKDKSLFPSDGIYMHDHWLGLIAFAFGKIDFVPEQLVKYRQHDHNVTNNVNLNKINRIKNCFNSEVRKNYLQEKFRQAEAFYFIFDDSIGELYRDYILEFLSLERRSFLYKKFYVGINRFVKIY